MKSPMTSMNMSSLFAICGNNEGFSLHKQFMDFFRLTLRRTIWYHYRAFET